MRGWFGDFMRMAGALWYWNARKSVFVLRGRRGRAPCQHPSDSGRAFDTACEASSPWRDRARFARHVCPLLKCDAKGRWMCSVNAAAVRPYWGRAAAFYSGGVVALVLVAGMATFGGMRAIGYRPTLRQVFWPPAWGELREVRAQYFVAKAASLIATGNARAAALALTSAYETSPHSYAIGMTMAQFYLVWRPDLVDRVFEDLMEQHPAQQAQTADVWLHSLLARGELGGVAALARRQLTAKSGDPGPWTHALIFAARLLDKPDLLDAAAQEAIPEQARAVLALEASLPRVSEGEARRRLFQDGTVSAFAYANYERVDRLIEMGDVTEALVLLQNVRQSMAGRDVARFALAVYAVARNETARQSEALTLLAAKGADAAGTSLVAVHLIKYPNREILKACIAALDRAGDVPADVILAVYFATVCGNDREDLPALRMRVAQTRRSNEKTLENFEELVQKGGADRALLAVIPLVQPMNLELNYALLEKAHARARAAVQR